jgi:exopolysaccharide production protein ExoZ
MGQGKQAGIQVARAVAALSIVYFHSWVALNRFPAGTAHPIPVLGAYGWFAVDLFFAISGYVICLVVSRQNFQAIPFLVKRIFRLYPLWIVTLVMFAIMARLWRGLTPRETPEFFLYSATLLPTDGFPFYDIGWSLQHEMAFYLMAALIVPVLGLNGLLAILATSTIAFQIVDMPWFFAMLANHHGEFLAGAIAFVVRHRAARFGFLIPAVLGLVMLAFMLGFSLGSRWFPLALLPLIVAFTNLRPQAWWGTTATLLGDASYSIYLIHPLVFLAVSAIVSRFPGTPLWSQEPIRFAAILVIVGLSVLSWRYFESNAIAFGNRLVGSVATKPQAA